MNDILESIVDPDFWVLVEGIDMLTSVGTKQKNSPPRMRSLLVILRIKLLLFFWQGDLLLWSMLLQFRLIFGGSFVLSVVHDKNNDLGVD